MNSIEVEFKGQKYQIPALKYRGRLWFHWRGQTFDLELPGESRRLSSDKTSVHPGVFKAPMPGKITRVSVQVGDTVTRGQVLVVMEAMKMEYSLQADQNGVVTEINATKDAQVRLGDVLVRVKV